LSFGNYDGGRPPVAVRPQRVRTIRQLRQNFAYRYSGSSYFNLLTEFYLTSRPGDENAKLLEIGFFLHTPAPTLHFAKGGKLVGTTRDKSGRLWLIYLQGTFCMFIPEGAPDILRGTIDMKSMLNSLMKMGLVSGNEWFNGMAFGLEPAPGGGATQMTVDHWQVFYQ
jgi:hypothetical protein